jgi:hypothetical protein
MQSSRRNNKKSRRSRSVPRPMFALTGRIRESSQFFVNSTLTGGTAAFVNLHDLMTNSSYSNHLVTLGTAFQFYRFRDLRVIINPFNFASPPNNTFVTVGFQSMQQDSVPNAQEIMAMPRSMIMTVAQTTPAPFLVPRSILLGQTTLKWWRRVLPSQTTPTAGNPLPTSSFFDLVQGCIWLLADTTLPVTLRFQYTVEFQGAENIGDGLSIPKEPLRVETSSAVVGPPFVVHHDHGWRRK